MPEHTIPESLVENIRSGRAVLVVGVGIGVPSWKQILERMNQMLRERGGPGDEAASRDVEKLVREYHELLGLPMTADAETSAGTPRMQWLWRDDRTEFMFAEFRPALEDVRAIALLIDREGEKKVAR